MKRILLTNDDGVESDGLHALAESLAPLGAITIVAPLVDASAVGHALTLERPLRIVTIREGVYTVDGTPTDCVNLAVAKVLEHPPHLVVSGINSGYNLGDDVTYSGTVAGAMEGALLGIPAMAVSLHRTRCVPDFREAGRAAHVIAREVLARGLPPRTFLNVNVPRHPAKGFRITVLAKATHVTSVREVVDSQHQPYYWMQEGLNTWEPHDRSDYQTVADGWISITPLHPDLTNYGALTFVEELAFRTPKGAHITAGPESRPGEQRESGRGCHPVLSQTSAEATRG